MSYFLLFLLGVATFISEASDLLVSGEEYHISPGGIAFVTLWVIALLLTMRRDSIVTVRWHRKPDTLGFQDPVIITFRWPRKPKV